MSQKCAKVPQSTPLADGKLFVFGEGYSLVPRLLPTREGTPVGRGHPSREETPLPRPHRFGADGTSFVKSFGMLPPPMAITFSSVDQSSPDIFLNAGGIAVDHILFRFWIPGVVLEIFAIKIESCQKSR